MTKPVHLAFGTHTHLITIKQATGANRSATVGRQYPAWCFPKGVGMPDGSGPAPGPFIAYMNDVNYPVTLIDCARTDIELEAVTPQRTNTSPSVLVHEADGAFCDCTPGKTYPAKRYNTGDIDAEGLINRSTSLGFFDDVGDFVNQSQGGGLATLNW